MSQYKHQQLYFTKKLPEQYLKLVVDKHTEPNDDTTVGSIFEMLATLQSNIWKIFKKKKKKKNKQTNTVKKIETAGILGRCKSNDNNEENVREKNS